METNLIGELNMMKETGIKPNFSEVAKRYGVDRHTVAKCWNGGGPQPGDGRSGRASGFDPFAGEIEDRAQLPGATAKGVHEWLLDRHDDADPPLPVGFVDRNAREGTADWGRSLLLLCYEHGELIGILCIRYELSKELEDIYGNIGYSVRPSKRNRGYATKMLRHALEVCGDCGLGSVTLGCYEDNAASAAVIHKCGGVLVDVNQNYTEGKTSQYYVIHLSSCA